MTLDSERKRIYADLDYLTRNKVTLLRTGAYDTETYSKDAARLDCELERIGGEYNAHRETEAEMVEAVLSFSDLVRKAADIYANAFDQEKQKVFDKVFEGLLFENGKFEAQLRPAFAALLQRHEPCSVEPKNDSTKSQNVENGNPGGLGFLTAELGTVYAAIKDELERWTHCELMTCVGLPKL